MPSFQIENSVAFVTGTNRKNGIGRALVKALIEHGAKKVYATARNADQLQDFVAEYEEGKVVPVALDVTDFETLRDLSQHYPDVNLVVNNAGYMAGTGSFDDVDKARMEIFINYLAPMAIVKSFSDQLKKNKNAAVVNVASIAALINFPQGATYSASKAAVHSLTQAQRRDLPEALIMGVYPGPIDTDMASELPFEKESTSTVALAMVKALERGEEEVFPDKMAAQLFDSWKSDFKAVEKQMAVSA